MPFILADQRDRDCTQAFADYRAYLASVADRFPKSAYALATSDWYFDFTDHRCPHDARLISGAIQEPEEFDHYTPPSIKIRLLGAYGDGFIELEYAQVFHYALSYKGAAAPGHQDWRYDEFRVIDAGHVIHEIEWCGATDTGNWLIEASDVSCTWVPGGEAA